jgi:ATP-dependent Lon protease
VLEYLLGQHCATDDPTLISEGLESVRRILAKHYVHRNQAELVKSTIKERGTYKVIDKLTVELNEKGGFYEVEGAAKASHDRAQASLNHHNSLQ